MADVATITGFQPVAPYEARQLARAEQRRARSAKATKRILRGLDATVNNLNYSINHLESELAATRAKVCDRDAREYRSEFGHRTFWLLVAGLLGLEVPLNMAALDFLRQSESHSFAIALLVSVVTALAAKFTGRVLRQKRWNDRAYREWSLAALFNISFALAIWKIAALRGLLAGNASAGLTVACLQVASYVAVVALSFIHIDPDDDREQLTRLAAVQDKRLQQKWSGRVRVANRHNTELAAGELTLIEIEQDAIERLSEYRDSNMRCRTESAPEYFRRPLTRALFLPINLGTPLDAHPREISEVIGDTARENNDDD